jgi:hypothetical protein
MTIVEGLVLLPGTGPWPGWRAWTARDSRDEVEIDRVELLVAHGHQFAIGFAARTHQPWLLLSRVDA